VPQSPGKQPHGLLWTRKEELVYGADAARVAGWSSLDNIGDHPGIGIACGTAVGIDLDIYDKRLADEFEEFAVEMLGATPLRRVGEAPKRLLVYRCDDGLPTKLQTPEMFKDGLKAKAELLGQGLQFVAYGIHPATLRPFTWGESTPETVSLTELPAVTRGRLEAYLQAVLARLRAEGYRAKAEIDGAAEPPPRSNGADHGANPFKTINDEAMARPEAWVRDLFPTAKKQAGTGAWRVSSADLGRPLEEDLSIAPSGIVDFGVADQGDPRQGKRTPIDLVIERGKAADAKEAAAWLAKRLNMKVQIGKGSASPEPREGAAAQPQSPNQLIDSLRVVWADDIKLSLSRPGLIDGLLGTVGMTVIYGESGSGKTVVAVDTACHIATGKAWRDLDVEQGTVIYVAAENAASIQQRI
jgi:hypothetical protein